MVHVRLEKVILDVLLLNCGESVIKVEVMSLVVRIGVNQFVLRELGWKVIVGNGIRCRNIEY